MSEEIRTPPYDNVAEQSVLGGMMLSKDAIADVVEVLRGNDFYKPAHESIYEAIMSLYGKGEPADAITVADELTKRGELERTGGPAYLHSLISSVPTAANAGFYAEIVQERAVLRRLVTAGTKIVQLGYSQDGEVEVLVNEAQSEIMTVAERRNSEDYVVLKDVVESTVQEIEDAGGRSGMQGVPTGFVEFDELTHGLQGGQMIVIAARPAMGKALALDTPIPTPTGWTTMGEISVGDQVLAADGTTTAVTAATDVMLDRPCYRVGFDDGSEIIADEEHQWLTHTRAARRVRVSSGRAPTAERVGGEVVTTSEIRSTLRTRTAEARLNHSIPNAHALHLPAADLPVEPYTLGAWLGDGATSAARVTNVDPEVFDRIRGDGYVLRRVTDETYAVSLPREERELHKICEMCGTPFTTRNRNVRACSRSCGGRLSTLGRPTVLATCIECGAPCSGGLRCSDCHAATASFQGILRQLGVLNHKHIPDLYLRASESQRRALLAGLLDTDGTVTNAGCVQFTVTSRALADGFRELAHSLGYRTGMREKVVPGRHESSSIAYKVTFSTADDVFGLSRKQRTHRERDARPTAKRVQRFVTSVEPVESVPVRCLQVDHPEHLFLVGRSFIPTHNSTFAIDIARSAAIKHNMTTAIFSLEMARNEIALKILSAEATLNLQDLRKGTLQDEQWGKIASTMGKLDSAPLFIDDSPNMSLMEIRAKCRRLKQKHDLKLVVLDYLQLMSSGKKVESRQQEVSEFSRALKLLAKELDVPVIALSQLNRGSEQRTDKRPMVSDLRESGCLTGDTRILRADTGAETTMQELFDSGARDIPVWTMADDMRYVKRPMTHVFSTGIKPVYRLKLASGRSIRATANHRFRTYDGWRALGDLVPDMRLTIPRHVGAPDKETNWADAEVIMLAHLLGDGSFVKRQPIRYASIDEANLQAVAGAAEHFGITAVRDEYAVARCTTLRLPSPFRLARGKRNPIAQWLDQLGLFGLRSHEKHVPDEVFSLSKRQIRLFLHHIWSTDGSVTVNKAGRGGRIYYSTTSLRLAQNIMALLARFGIVGRLKSSTKATYKPSYSVDISGSEDQLMFLEQIGVHGSRSEPAATLLGILRTIKHNTNVDTVPLEVWADVRRIMQDSKTTTRSFQSALGTQYCGDTLYKTAMSLPRLARVIEALDTHELDVLALNDVFWDRIVSIEEDGVEEVFDATVVGSHNFIADGITVHNSIEQDADMVILLHRDDVYDKESPRAGEADVIVAKHRNGPTKTIVVAFQGHYSRFANMANEGF